MNLFERVEAAKAAEMKALAVTYKTQYLVECGDEIIKATDSLVEAAQEIEELSNCGINCVAILMSRNGDAFEVIDGFMNGKPHRPSFDEATEAAIIALLNP